MNKLIKELRGQVKMDLTKFHSDPEFYKNHVDPLAKIFVNGDNAVLNEYMTKFAELIVKDCMKVADLPNSADGKYDNFLPSEMIAKHFGVEE